MRATIERSSEVIQSPRVTQCAGLFDVPLAKRDERRWEVDLPVEAQPWNIGLVVGPSGAGKSTILREMFGKATTHEWDPARSVLDGFPDNMAVKQVTGALSAVGFSSPPSWMRPYQTLSNGEQFRVDVARTLVEAGEGVAVVDEFSSVVDRQVAKVASAAVAKWVRREGKQLVAASCHYDIIDWLQPDWIYDLGGSGFTARSLCPRPRITLTVTRCGRDLWPIFERNHYLSGDLHNSARCFVGLVNGQPAVFAAAIPFPHPKAKNIWRGHRTVTLPDYQGVGLGNALSEYVASVYRTAGMRYRSTTASPAMIRHRARSPLWLMTRAPSRVPSSGRKGIIQHVSSDRLTSTAEYVGPGAPRADVVGLRPLDMRFPTAESASVTSGGSLGASGGMPA